MPLAATDLPQGLWATDVPILFGHCDPAGIVYTPHYFNIFNGVIEIWHGQRLGLDYYGLITERRLALGYGHAACDFFAPSRMGDTLRVAVAIAGIGRSSLTLLLHATRDGREVVRGRFVSVATSLETHTVVQLPADLRTAYEAYRHSVAA